MMKLLYALLKMFAIYCILAGSIFYIADGEDATVLGSLGKGFGFGYNELAKEMEKSEDGEDLKGSVNATIDFYEENIETMELGTKEDFKSEFEKTQK